MCVSGASSKNRRWQSLTVWRRCDRAILLRRRPRRSTPCGYCHRRRYIGWRLLRRRWPSARIWVLRHGGSSEGISSLGLGWSSHKRIRCLCHRWTPKGVVVLCHGWPSDEGVCGLHHRWPSEGLRISITTRNYRSLRGACPNTCTSCRRRCCDQARPWCGAFTGMWSQTRHAHVWRHSGRLWRPSSTCWSIAHNNRLRRNWSLSVSVWVRDVRQRGAARH